MKETGQHDARFYGAILRVEDLSACRTFYAEVIGLGEPVVDSSFWVEFQVVPGQMVLALQQAPVTGTGTAEPARNVAWCLETTDVEAFVRRLERDNVHPLRTERSPTGRKTLTFLDPEGNPFVIMEGAAATRGEDRGGVRTGQDNEDVGR